MSRVDTLTPNPFAIARLLLAARARGFGGAHGARGLDREAARRGAAWGEWIDAAIEAGFAGGDVMASVPRATFGLTVWGEPGALDGLLVRSGMGDVERVRFMSLASSALAVGAWIVEDDDGFEGGFACGPLPPVSLRAILPGPGVAKVIQIADELGLEAVDEVRRTVNPGGEATECTYIIDSEAPALIGRAWRSAVAAEVPSGLAALLAEASGPASLILKASERGVTGIGARVPIATATALARGLTAVGARQEDDDRLAATLGAIGLELPDQIDVMRRAGGLELRAWCLADTPD